MWFVLGAFFLGAALRVAVPKPDDTQAIAAFFLATIRKWRTVIVFVCAVIVVGVLCFFFADLRSPWFRFGVLIADLLAYLPSIGLGTFISYMTTDFLIRHQSSEKTLIPGFILGSGALVLLITAVFPASVLRNALSSVETPVATLKFAAVQQQTTQQHQPTLIPTANSNRHEATYSEATDGALYLYSELQNIQESLLYASKYITGDRNAPLHSGHASQSDFLVYRHIIKPIADCALELRSVTDSEDPEFITSTDFLNAFRSAYKSTYSISSPISKNKQLTNTALHLRDIDLKSEIERIEKLYLLLKYENRSPFDHRKCSPIPFLGHNNDYSDLIKRLFSGLQPEFYLDRLNFKTPHAAYSIANLLVMHNMRKDAVDELYFWIHFTRKNEISLDNDIGKYYSKSNDRRIVLESWSLYKDMSILVALNWAGIFNDVDTSPYKEVLIQGDAIRHFENMSDRFPKVKFFYEKMKSSSNYPFEVDGKCDYEPDILNDNELDKTVAENTLKGIRYIFRTYVSKMNNFSYIYTARPDIFNDMEKHRIASRYLNTLREIDYDCLNTGGMDSARNIALAVADTYVNARIRNVVELHNKGENVDKHISRLACDLVPVKRSVQDILRHMKSKPNHDRDDYDTALGFVEYVKRNSDRRVLNENIDLAEKIVAYIERLMIETGGDTPSSNLLNKVNFRMAYQKICGE